jgi:hypothetical protein
MHDIAFWCEHRNCPYMYACDPVFSTPHGPLRSAHRLGSVSGDKALPTNDLERGGDWVRSVIFPCTLRPASRPDPVGTDQGPMTNDQGPRTNEGRHAHLITIYGKVEAMIASRDQNHRALGSERGLGPTNAF